MSITEQGRAGEKWARRFLKEMGCEVFQIDWIAKKGDNPYFGVEVKCQERFKSPPFDGHGLPLWQVNARMDFQKKTGIRTLLLIAEKPDGEVFSEPKDVFFNWIDKLESGKHFDTKGRSPRRIYPVEAFIRRRV